MKVCLNANAAWVSPHCGEIVRLRQQTRQGLDLERPIPLGKGDASAFAVANPAVVDLRFRKNRTRATLTDKRDGAGQGANLRAQSRLHYVFDPR
jgi:hypothetical protein